MAKYYVKVNFNPLSEENNINHTHQLLKTENNKVQRILIISKPIFQWFSIDFCAI